MTVKYTFGQRDLPWANHLLNNVAGSTIGKYGCTTDAYGVALGYYLGKSINPQQAEEYIRSHGAYTKDLVLWTKLPYFRWRFYCEATPAPVNDIKAELRAGKMVLLNVDLSGNDDKPDHWVLCLDENFTIFDPWYNEIAPITKRYGKPEREIFGGAYFNWPAPPATPAPTTNKVTMEEIFSNIFIAFFERWPNSQELAEFKASGDYNRPYTYVQNKWIHQWKDEKASAEGSVSQLRQAIAERDSNVAELNRKSDEQGRSITSLEESLSKLQKETSDQIEQMKATNENAVKAAYNHGREVGYAEGKAESKPEPEKPSEPVEEPTEDPAKEPETPREDRRTLLEKVIDFIIKLISKK